MLARTLIFGLLAAAASGCSRETRYEVLTFFFTGVPPLEAEDGAAPSKNGETVTDFAALSAQRRGQTQARLLEQRLRALKWTHGPYGAAQCDRCHAVGGSVAFRGQPAATAAAAKAPTRATRRLVMPAEELCLTCHTTKTTSLADSQELRLHGPVASGLCIGCHSPHQSPRRYMLLGKDNVELCTRCHLLDGLQERTPVHAAVDTGKDCLDCHNPHMGKSALILRSDFQEPDTE